MTAHTVFWISKTLWSQYHSLHFKMGKDRIKQVIKVTPLRPKTSREKRTESEFKPEPVGLQCFFLLSPLYSLHHCQYKLELKASNQLIMLSWYLLKYNSLSTCSKDYFSLFKATTKGEAVGSVPRGTGWSDSYRIGATGGWGRALWSWLRTPRSKDP